MIQVRGGRGGSAGIRAWSVTITNAPSDKGIEIRKQKKMKECASPVGKKQVYVHGRGGEH